MSSIIPPVNEMDPDIFSFSIEILFVNFKDSALVKVTVSFLVSIDGEDISSSFFWVFSILFVPYQLLEVVGQKILTTLSILMQIKKLLKWDFYLPYYFSSLFVFKFGAGSNPSLPPKNLIGWHLKILFTPRTHPSNVPFNFMQSIK